MDSPDQRRAMLPAIEATVDAGKTVPIGVYPTERMSQDHFQPDKGHQLVILAAQGDMLEIYNPWGYTEWVTKQQFIDGHLGELTGDSPTAGLPSPPLRRVA